ncbi:hypothetical protein GJ688_19390 [Heliobacillus mobilis]|uniref:Uncharacterized protein n=1 Tax=Heliobacterium mobile TaxID=28064 RepID=A0A6I3SPS3_HELMO|nr:hypothetical protein [Heliobacterium mobile]
MVTNAQVLEASKYLNNLIITQWVTEHFLSPLWLSGVLLILFSYVLFFYLVDKKRIIEILLFGSLVAVSFSVYNATGSQFDLWIQFKRVLPLNPNFFLGDLTLIPLYGMLVYQYTSSWKSFFLWNVIWAGAFAFGLYFLILVRLDAFRYFISFGPIIDFIFLTTDGIVARGILVSLLKLETRHGNLASKRSLSELIAQPVRRPSDFQDRYNDD